MRPTNPAPAPTHTPWNPYTKLPDAIKRKLEPEKFGKGSLAAYESSLKTYLQALHIPDGVAAERLAGKYLQLETPKGKESDQRKEAREKKTREKKKKRDAGMVGRRKRVKEASESRGKVRYEAVEALHSLWLGYMADLLALPVTVNPSPPPEPNLDSVHNTSTSVLLPTFPPKTSDSSLSAAADLKMNVPLIQTKLLKAEFVGCKLTVKRSKNPSLAGLTGIVLQETQGTFKIVTPTSQLKVLPKPGSVFTFSLPLASQPGHPDQQRTISLDIYGDAFAYRSAERVSKKWKAGSGPGTVDLL
ncbi:hypothetical protein T439DRAFT_321178 [Meredithblackwellia eburnea MCA 4105]